MKIEFPLLSIFSVCVLLFFGLQGDVEFYSWELGFSFSPNEIRLTVDPVWVVWTDSPVMRDLETAAFSFGNCIVVSETYPYREKTPAILRYEHRHIRQFQALGLGIYPASLILNVRGEPYYSQGIDVLESCYRAMWLPPASWPAFWHFLTVFSF